MADLTWTDYQTFLSQASAALATSSYSTARVRVLQARLALAAGGGKLTADQTSVEIASLDTLLAQIKELEVAANRAVDNRRFGRIGLSPGGRDKRVIDGC